MSSVPLSPIPSKLSFLLITLSYPYCPSPQQNVSAPLGYSFSPHFEPRTKTFSSHHSKASSTFLHYVTDFALASTSYPLLGQVSYHCWPCHCSPAASIVIHPRPHFNLLKKWRNWSFVKRLYEARLSTFSVAQATSAPSASQLMTKQLVLKMRLGLPKVHFHTILQPLQHGRNSTITWSFYVWQTLGSW